MSKDHRKIQTEKYLAELGVKLAAAFDKGATGAAALVRFPGKAELDKLSRMIGTPLTFPDLWKLLEKDPDEVEEFARSNHLVEAKKDLASYYNTTIPGYAMDLSLSVSYHIKAAGFSELSDGFKAMGEDPDKFLQAKNERAVEKRLEAFTYHRR